MRAKVAPGRKAKTIGVSMFPPQKRFVNMRSNAADISVSKYFQVLAALDEREDLLGRALTLGLDKEAA